MPDTRRRLSEEDFESAATHVAPSWWATGDQLLYGPEMERIPNWRTYGSPGFRMLTKAQQTLLYWGDLIGEVANGGLAQLYQNKQNIIDDVRTAAHALAWTELNQRLDQAHFAYIAPSKTAEQWRQQKRKADREAQKQLLKSWQAGINTYEPLPIWLIDYWSEHGWGHFNSAKALAGWRKKYRNQPPDASMLWVFAAQAGAKINPRMPEEVAFSAWFCRDETKTQSAEYVERFIRNHKRELVAIS